MHLVDVVVNTHLACPACLWHAKGLQNVLLLLSFFLTVLLETSYLRMYSTDLYQIFRIGTNLAGHDQSNLLFAIAQRALLL